MSDTIVLTFHIRRRLRPARGNQYYKDYSNRGQGTYCGAPETEYDCAWRDKASTWQAVGISHECCPTCQQARAAEAGAA